MIVKLEITGIVQGVGFRPFAKREADALGVYGSVLNKGSAVEIVAEAEEKALNTYIQRLISHIPEGAFILNYTKEIITDSTKVFSPFKILSSEKTVVKPTLISPDIATCSECEKEFRNSTDRRHFHPFISCALCGPRYSIIKSMPYDRDTTVMDKFEMCEDCKTEYSNISDRRCFAQTIACHECGPVLEFTTHTGKAENPLDGAVKALNGGKVIAVKDIGGYHFAVKTDSVQGVNDLRRIKNREVKPFAVMFKDVNEVKQYCSLNKAEQKALTSSARPIVLLDKLKDFKADICSGSYSIGAMLPCNPVQIYLLSKCSPLVMTSGNITEEPIITDNSQMLNFLSGCEWLYGVLSHDRDILTPLDDSIVRVVEGKTLVSRRARGFVPLPIKVDLDGEIFACGGDLKSSFCIVKDGYAYMSQHLGDMENERSFKVYKKTAERLQTLLNSDITSYACDMHPAYITAGYRKQAHKVQHHHAHILSVMAEHNLKGKVLGFAFDGTGYGTDGTVWGSEVMICNGTEYKRVNALKPVKMCGGNLISKDANRVLNCYKAVLSECDDTLLCRALEKDINCTYYSSMGRLFDAVSALLGICEYNTYEGECASKLETSAYKGTKELPLKFDFDGAGVIRDVELLLRKGCGVNDIALSFHTALANGIADTAKQCGIKDVVLTGGVFNNKILLRKTIKLLKSDGFNVYINEKIPMGDGGIALGQAYYASEAERIK